MANFEFNPFELDTPLSSTAIESITLSSNSNLFSLGDALLGPNPVLGLDLASVAPHMVLSTGAATGVPVLRLLDGADLPSNIGMSQITGLQSALNALVKTLASANAYLSVTSNAQGDHTLTPNIGTIANTLAAGNDSRFPSSVTGIRKGAGVGSLDTAAVAKTDYWDTSPFVASGASHAKGLVPDPGVTAGTTKFLREDATWVIPTGSGTVTSVALTVPSDILAVAGSPVTTSGTLAITKQNQNANLVYAGPTTGGAAAPTFRAHVYADVSALVGTVASTLAAGNDTRFPASVTGLRKSSGAGSTDVAAVLFTDYWNNTVFAPKGPSHAIGLVPDPGAGVGPYTRYLREDATWQVFTPDTASITNAMLATMATKTLKANATGSTASPTDIDAKTARSSLLNLESITTVGNVDYTALPTDKYVATSASLTATRTVTLPLANSFNPGQAITIADDFGGINVASGFFLNVARQGADTIQGAAAAVVLNAKYASVTLSSDGTSKWSIVKRLPSVRHVIISSNGTYTTPVGCKALLIEALGGGGGGAGAVGAVGQAAAGAGGGAGGYVTRLEESPAASYAVVIGLGGTGGVGNAQGGSGGGTTFAGVVQASGGYGGNFMAAGTTPAFALGGDGQYASAGDWGSTGSDGGKAIRQSGTIAASGDGGAASVWSGTTKGIVAQGDGNNANSLRHYGGGGGGALSLNTTSQTGGPGSSGVIIVTEYY